MAATQRFAEMEAAWLETAAAVACVLVEPSTQTVVPSAVSCSSLNPVGGVTAELPRQVTK